MRRVLFITYFYPPGASSGVFRPLKFVKYMAKGGEWKPIVLTMDEAHYGKLDQSLMKDVPESLEIHRVGSLQPTPDSSDRYRKLYHQIHLPDSAVGGIMHLVLKGLEIINQQSIDLIFCTIPHPSMAVAGKMLKDMTGIPLVVDYRDGWTTNPMTKPRSLEGRQINDYFERKVLGSADGIVVVDDQLKQDLIGLGYRSDIEVILNGFDQDDFETIGEYTFGRAPGERIISYCGYIYHDYVPSLLTMAAAIDRWNREHPNRRISFHLAGEFQRQDDQERLLACDGVRYAGQLDYRAAIQFVSSSDASVGVMTMDYSMGGKFYNLLLAKQYIFAFIHHQNHQIKKLLQDYSGKRFIGIDASAEEAFDAIHNWQDNAHLHLSTYMPAGYLAEYSREYQTRQLERYFNLLVK